MARRPKNIYLFWAAIETLQKKVRNMFKGNNKDTQDDANNIILVSLLET